MTTFIDLFSNNVFDIHKMDYNGNV